MTLSPAGFGEPSATTFPSQNPLTRKLSLYAQLSESDRRVLDALLTPEERFPADVDIIAEGMSPRSVFVMKEGMAVRYRNLPDGSRQIMTFLIPGDLCDAHVFLLKTMDHSLATITRFGSHPSHGKTYWTCSSRGHVSPLPCGGAHCRRNRCCESE